MVMPIIHHTIPMVVATGATTRIAEKALPSRRRTIKSPKKSGTIQRRTIKRVVKKAPPKRKAVPIHRKEQKLPPGKWVQLSREELVHLVGKAKADKVKAGAGKPVKIGMYDKAVYINGKYYLNIS